jgi:phosphate transport system protein
MLNEIVDAFHGEGKLSRLLRSFDEMLDRCREMLLLTDPANVNSADMNRVYEEIYRLDRMINRGDRRMRYQILKHLTDSAAQDASICMVLVVVCKDAERIGDYCKNIFEVLLYAGPSRFASMHVGQFQRIRDQVAEMIPRTQRAFVTGDVISAQAVIASAGELSKLADFIVQEILEAKGEQITEPASKVLLARHYKRMSSHLSNICTAVTSPVDMLGYHDDEEMTHRAEPEDAASA